MDRYLVVARTLLLLTLLFFLLFHFFPPVERWCRDQHAALQDRYRAFGDLMDERMYHVQEAERRPAVSVREFYALPAGHRYSALRARPGPKAEPDAAHDTPEIDALN